MAHQPFAVPPAHQVRSPITCTLTDHWFCLRWQLGVQDQGSGGRRPSSSRTAAPRKKRRATPCSCKHQAVISKNAHIRRVAQLDRFFLTSISFSCDADREPVCLVLCIVLFFYLMSCHRVKVSYRLGGGSSQDAES